MSNHLIGLAFAQETDTRKPITTLVTVTDDDSGEVLHQYEMDEHTFLRLLRGGVVRTADTMTKED